jgi:hypothetical protein
MSGQLPTETRTIIRGSSALAREVGLSQAAVSKKLRRGMTPDQVRAEARSKGRVPEVAQSGAYVPRNGRRNTLTAPVPAPGTTSRPPVTPPVPARQLASVETYEDALVAHAERESRNAAELRKITAQADAYELENLRARGDLIPRAKVELWGVGYLVRARELLEQFPGMVRDRLAVESDPVKVEAILRAEAERVMRALSKLAELWDPAFGQAGERERVKKKVG